MVKFTFTIIAFVGSVWFLTGHVSYFWSLVIAFVAMFSIRSVLK